MIEVHAVCLIGRPNNSSPLSKAWVRSSLPALCLAGTAGFVSLHRCSDVPSFEAAVTRCVAGGPGANDAVIVVYALGDVVFTADDVVFVCDVKGGPQCDGEDGPPRFPIISRTIELATKDKNRNSLVDVLVVLDNCCWEVPTRAKPRVESLRAAVDRALPSGHQLNFGCIYAVPRRRRARGEADDSDDENDESSPDGFGSFGYAVFSHIADQMTGSEGLDCAKHLDDVCSKATQCLSDAPHADAVDIACMVSTTVGRPWQAKALRLSTKSSLLQTSPPSSSRGAAGATAAVGFGSVEERLTHRSLPQPRAEELAVAVRPAAMAAVGAPIAPVVVGPDTFHCDVCNCDVCGLGNWDQHVTSQRHMRKLQMQTPSEYFVDPSLSVVFRNPSAYFTCDYCKTTICGEAQVQQHLQGRQHTRNLELARLRGGAPSNAVVPASNSYLL